MKRELFKIANRAIRITQKASALSPDYTVRLANAVEMMRAITGRWDWKFSPERPLGGIAKQRIGGRWVICGPTIPGQRFFAR